MNMGPKRTIQKIKLVFKLPENNRGNLIATAVYLVSAIFILVSSHYFPNLGWMLVAVALSLLYLILFTIAGTIVFKALFGVSAGLSLIIFIAQSYCGSSQRLEQSDQALRALITFGLLFIVYRFTRKIFKESDKEHNELIKANDGSRSWITLVMLASALGLFIYQLILVMEPIIKGLCVFS